MNSKDGDGRPRKVGYELGSLRAYGFGFGKAKDCNLSIMDIRIQDFQTNNNLFRHSLTRPLNAGVHDSPPRAAPSPPHHRPVFISTQSTLRSLAFPLHFCLQASSRSFGTRKLGLFDCRPFGSQLTTSHRHSKNPELRLLVLHYIVCELGLKCRVQSFVWCVPIMSRIHGLN